MIYLLDTDICIEALRGKASVVSKIKTLKPRDLAISTITRFELLYGAEKCSKKRQAVEHEKIKRFLSILTELDFDSSTAIHAARIRAELERAGTPIGPMDTLIASTALNYELTLCTGNDKEFSRVQGLKLENWR